MALLVCVCYIVGKRNMFRGFVTCLMKKFLSIAFNHSGILVECSFRVEKGRSFFEVDWLKEAIRCGAFGFYRFLLKERETASFHTFDKLSPSPGFNNYSPPPPLPPSCSFSKDSFP